MVESIENKSLDRNDIQHEFLYLCVHRFVRVPVSMVYSCYKGKPKMWNVYPANKEQELRSKSCKMHIIFWKFPSWFFSRVNCMLSGELLQRARLVFTRRWNYNYHWETTRPYSPFLDWPQRHNCTWTCKCLDWNASVCIFYSSFVKEHL